MDHFCIPLKHFLKIFYHRRSFTTAHPGTSGTNRRYRVSSRLITLRQGGEGRPKDISINGSTSAADILWNDDASEANKEGDLPPPPVETRKRKRNRYAVHEKKKKERRKNKILSITRLDLNKTEMSQQGELSCNSISFHKTFA
ncbi:hypothetical protein NPIL_541691 [Nephila pilipes]|uniref:Uncharacterized protein n=1 Tax=Nephila pilipes TaxID=299642 RepID=A0A8X6UDK1_NEPPI|nr:hypothetical protein NPIL_541691 [Nephila pilipes]